MQQCFVSRLKPPLWNERCGEIQLYTTVLCQPSEASTVGRSSCIQQCFVSRLKPPLWNKRCGEIQLYTTVLCQPYIASTVERDVWGDPAVYNSALSAVHSLHCGTRGVGRSSCMQQCFVSRLKPPLWNERCGEIQLYTTVLCQLYGASTVEREVWGDPAVCNNALSAV